MNRKIRGSMTGIERRSLMRGITFQANYIKAGCKIPLEEFKPPESQKADPQPSTSQQPANAPVDLCRFMNSYWDWLDECWTMLEAEESAHEEYDFDFVPIIFDSRKGLRGLHGEEYQLCQKALAVRPARIPWTSELGENGQFLSCKHVI
jgi:hypothetical protein